MTGLFIPAEYGWNILIAILISAQCHFTSFYVSLRRRKYFNKQFFETHFLHLKGSGLSYTGGYPDMGSGLFAQKLPMDQWLDFNNAQRVHYNYLEGLMSAVLLQLVAGIYFPTAAALLGVVYIFGRGLYSHLYVNQGAKGRTLGGRILNLALVSWLFMSLYTCFVLITAPTLRY